MDALSIGGGLAAFAVLAVVAVVVDIRHRPASPGRHRTAGGEQHGLLHSALRPCGPCGRLRVVGVRADGTDHCWTHHGPTDPQS